MAKTLVETVFGKFAKYEIVKESGLLSTEIRVYWDGKFVSTYSSVQAAVDAARNKG